jgi:hypothetical protein
VAGEAKVRWSVYCAVTKRPFRMNLDWTPYYAVAKKDLPYREKLREYAKISEERLETVRFEEFCQKHLSHLDEVAHEFFGSGAAKEAVRKKTAALFPAHEVEQFTELFWSRIQKWRADQAS